MLIGKGYIQSTADERIYVRRTATWIQITSAYVDDLGLFANSHRGMVKIKGELNRNFLMMDLREMKKILGIQIEQD